MHIHVLSSGVKLGFDATAALRSRAMTDAAWKPLGERCPPDARRICSRPSRTGWRGWSIEEAGIRFDFAKTHLSSDALAAFLALAEAGRTRRAPRLRCSRGETVNLTEGRAAEHTAERGQGAPDSVARAARAATPGCAP